MIKTNGTAQKAQNSVPRDQYQQTGIERAVYESKVRLWECFIGQRGKRYAACRFDNYQTDHPGQLAAVDQIKSHIELDCGGMVLVGPVGTGKDHLVSASIYQKIASGVFTNGIDCEYEKITSMDAGDRIQFWSGPSLFGAVRDGMTKRTTEAETINPLARTQLLVLSDLCNVGETLTDFQRQVIYRIVDQRYCHNRPTWLTANAQDRKQLEQTLGAAIVDRLLDGSLVVPCDWPSFRKTAKAEGKK